jgi:DedD protein
VNEVLKQRLVGALILVALGVIFWPIIFVQPEDEQVQERNIPPQPDVSTAPVDAPDPVGLRTSPSIVAHKEVAAEEKALETPTPDKVSLEPEAAAPVPLPKPAPKPAPAPAKPSPEELKLDADGVPVAWILQVVSVSAAEKAEELRGKLDAMGHKAYVEKVSSNGRTLYRIYIGPKFERGELDALKAQIDAEFGVSSMTRRYVP